MKTLFENTNLELKGGELFGIFFEENRKMLGGCPKEAEELLNGIEKQYEGKTETFFSTAIPAREKPAYLLYYCVKDAQDAEEWREAAGLLVREAYRLGLTSASVSIPAEKQSQEAFVKGMTEGAAMAAYQFDTYKSKKKPEFSELKFFGAHEEKLKATAAESCSVCEEVNFCRSLVDEIVSVMTPEVLADTIRSRAVQYNIECEIWDEKRIHQEGLRALEAVGKGSANPPRFIILRYNGAPESEKRLGLVGKGVTYDTGGYCLKPGSGMMDMKDDMGGAAAVCSALIAAAKQKLKVNVTAIVGACENSIDAGGFKPGDIIKTLKGTTIEVINTDAEGRITLSDSVYYAVSRERVTHIIDAATLTGSAISTFGSYYTAAITSDQAFYDEFKKAAIVSGEYFWQLPCDRRYRKLLESKVADIKNLAGREGGCIIAGMFIKDFTEELPWIHLDLCGAYYDQHRDSYVTDLATGQPVRTLYEMAKRMSKY